MVDAKPKQFGVLTIGEVVKRSGVAASALRFYEEKGLIHSLREDGDTGHRRYYRGVLRRIAFIVFAQRIGLSLDQIGVELAKTPRDRAPNPKEWEKISKTWHAAIDERIAELQRLQRGLGECIGCGCLSLETCQLANPQDRAGANGPGARYWIGDRRPRKG
jgi:MerR family redox-sensitive transcriptional activator SoxR